MSERQTVFRRRAGRLQSPGSCSPFGSGAPWTSSACWRTGTSSIAPTWTIDAILDKARAQLRRQRRRDRRDWFNYIELSGNSMAAILAGEFGFRGPSLRSVLTCEHKYWSRREAAGRGAAGRRAGVPGGRSVRPTARRRNRPAAAPFWLKPTRASAPGWGPDRGTTGDLDRANRTDPPATIHTGRPPVPDSLMDRIEPAGGDHAGSAGTTASPKALVGETAMHGRGACLRRGDSAFTASSIRSVLRPTGRSFRRYEITRRAGPHPRARCRSGRWRNQPATLVRRIGLDDCGFKTSSSSGTRSRTSCALLETTHRIKAKSH